MNLSLTAATKGYQNLSLLETAMSRKLSRKVIIALAAAAALAAPLLGSSASYARGFGFGGGGGGGGGMHFSAGRIGGSHAVFARRVAPIRVGRVGHVTHLNIARTGRLCALGRPCLPRPPIWVWHPHHHHHWVFRGGHWIIDDVAVAAPVDVAPLPAVAPSPCTCLTKTYTPTGLVVFADVCTKESASAPATDDTADASQAPSTQVPAKATPIAEVPTTPNYAGKTYEDYLAANPQSSPQASAPAPQAN
jgi:hypothetical protein